MNYKLKFKNNICFIKYPDGKMIELSRDKNHYITRSDKYVFILLNGCIDKVFDVNNKSFLTKSIEMQILYNNFKQYKKYNYKKKILTP